MNDTERKKAAAAIFTAAAEGKVIEWRHVNREWLPIDPFNLGSRWNVMEHPEFYRVKPEPVTRPWSKPEDVPGPVCWLETTTGAALITNILAVGIMYNCLTHNTARLVTWDDLQKTCSRHSTDRRTWHPCTVTE